MPIVIVLLNTNKEYMTEPCEFKQEIMNMGKTVSSMSEKLDNAIYVTRQHIESGVAWRRTIMGAWIGLVGSVVTFSIWCGVIITQVNYHKGVAND